MLPAGDPAAAPRCVQPRRPGLQYFVEHHSGRLYILRHAAGAADAALLAAPAAGPHAEADWEEVVPQRAGVALDDLDVFESALVLHERGPQGGARLTVVPMRPAAAPGAPATPAAGDAHAVPLPPWAAEVTPGANADFASPSLRLELSSPVRPPAPYDWHLAARRLAPAGAAPALAGHDPSDFVCERQWTSGSGGAPQQAAGSATGERGGGFGGDGLGGGGVSVPLTVVHARGFPLDGSRPCLVEVYAAYGLPLAAEFVAERVPLLRRGWAVALVHARGGGELGRGWAAAGREAGGEARADDVAAALDHLQRRGGRLGVGRACAVLGCMCRVSWISESADRRMLVRGGVCEQGRGAGRLARPAPCAHPPPVPPFFLFSRAGYSREGLFALEARSAGGVAAGAALRRRPAAFGAALLEAPFLDVLSAMCDPSLPLTQHEYEEWGDPATEAGFRRLRQTCPYAGLRPGAPYYPPMLLTCAQSDRRVPFWGPLKFAARVRAAAAGRAGGGGGGGGGEVLVSVDAHEGHWAGERERHEVKAAQYAFLLAAMRGRYKA
jgi:protease II